MPLHSCLRWKIYSHFELVKKENKLKFGKRHFSILFPNMFRSDLVALAFCLCIFQLSIGNVLKIQSKNGNKNINKIKVGVSFKWFFCKWIFFSLKIPVVAGKLNRTVASTAPTLAPTTPGSVTAFECSYESVV